MGSAAVAAATTAAATAAQKQCKCYTTMAAVCSSTGSRSTVAVCDSLQSGSSLSRNNSGKAIALSLDVQANTCFQLTLHA
jgi:hypothetical protein